MPDPDGRRRRPAMSCSLCRKRKIRCNRELPCSNCLRSRNEACIYDSPHPPPVRRNGDQGQTTETAPGQISHQSVSVPRQHSTTTSTSSRVSGQPLGGTVSSSMDASTPGSRFSTRDPEISQLRQRVRQLEDQISKSNFISSSSLHTLPKSDFETTNTHLGGTFHVSQNRGLTGQHPAIFRSAVHKTRLLGQSHWAVNVLLIRDIFETFDNYQQKNNTSAGSGIERCKSLARVIKAQRAPEWPTLPTRDLPPKEVADKLVDCYLRTTEAIHRILHIPTFQREYDAIWVLDAVQDHDMSFFIQLKLVLAIGATVYDEYFSLRVPAIRWIYEAQTWLSEPKFKSRLDIRFVQTNLLLLIAQERVGVGGETTWISIGSLLRKSICMGLHRDPVHLPQRSVFAVEMHRRLWNTILELALQSSLTCGGPPLISLDEFDTQPPGNFNDHQLMCPDPVARPLNEFTQTSIAILLQRTFPERLSVTKFLNDLSSPGTYEETLRLDTDLRKAYKDLSHSLREINNSATSSAPSKCDVFLVDFIMHRYLLSLHVPYFGPGLQQAAYAFSRQVVIESSLKIWRKAYPSSSLAASQYLGTGRNSEVEGLSRLTRCCSGFYPTVAIQAAFLIAVELRSQLQEESLSPVLLRPDLLSVLNEAKEWCFSAIQAGETNVKGYLLMSVLSAQIEGIMNGLGADDIAKLLIKAVDNVEVKCLPILEDIAATLKQGEDATDDIQQAISSSLGNSDEWAFMDSDFLFNGGDAGAMGWVFSDESTTGITSL